MNIKKYKYLGRINSSQDVKKLQDSDIDPLCREIRDSIVDTVTQNGGHLASNLGVVELTVALHRVFDCPRDHIIFDVGHQSYAHKILTGRFNKFDTLRRAGGISGFTNREESECDCFGAGHSSTSLSAALGFAEADRLLGNDAYTVVVLGDGAYTGGMIHEALNNCDSDLRLIIILNENEMSISKNIGRFAGSIAKLRRKSGYFKAKRFTVNAIKKIPLIGGGLFRMIRGVKKFIKNTMYGSNYFEDMGLYYLGPADGNNYRDVESLLQVAKSAGESVLIHLKTQKGKGYTPAENSPDEYHGVMPSDRVPDDSSFSHEFGKVLCGLSAENDKICAITAAMSSGTGLDGFAAAHPDRFFDVGIAEEHAVTFAAGLAANGMKPVFAVYSTFLQRSYDQMIHDVALQRLPVVFCIDRAGFNNADGSTHHGIFDVAFISQMTGFKIYSPVTYEGLKRSLETALSDDLPSAIRYVSGGENRAIKNAFYKNCHDRKIGVRCDFAEADKPKNIIITHGRIAAECLAAKEELSEQTGIILCEYLAPYDRLAEEIEGIISRVKPDNILFVEEEIKSGGFGINLSEQMKKISLLDGVSYHIIATEDPFVKRGEGENYIDAAGVGRKDIIAAFDQLNKKILN